ncbi:unnamed protein product, partial [Lampetra planeri]
GLAACGLTNTVTETSAQCGEEARTEVVNNKKKKWGRATRGLTAHHYAVCRVCTHADSPLTTMRCVECVHTRTHRSPRCG